MSCTKRFLNFQWEHHHWRRDVSGTEIITAEEPDMWGRPVFRDHVRCDTRQVCDVCGAVRHERSCLCDPARGDACKIRQERLTQSGHAPH